METLRICPNCRKPLPPDVPLGLCPECLIKSGFPTEHGTGVSGEAAGARFVPPPVEEIIQLFPQLEILGLIGKGGMGAVYKARQPMLDRIIALKVLPPAVAGDPGFAERFNREARALARLNHPNIVAVYDFGKAGNLHYLLMEFVDGTNLRQVEQAGKLSSEQALTIVPKICEALQYAHDQGVVHRDIKPENILVDKSGRVKIADFGIAKMVGQGPTDVSLTGAKDVVGTPHYMAPEQIEKPQAVDHRADIYSLGVVFYEMLTGELPLGKFAPPSTKVVVDVRLDEVVLHALEKEPARRYQQASQVKSDVETIAGTTGPAGKAGAAPLSFAARSGQATSDKAMLPALLLAFPFGVFGVHRFYVGKIGTGFLQLGALFGCILLIVACAARAPQPFTGLLLAFLMLGCLIWAIMDWILILCKAFTDGEGRRMTHWLHPQNGDAKPHDGTASGTPPTLPPGGTIPPIGASSPPPPMTPEKPSIPGTGLIVAPAVGLMIAALWKLLSAFENAFFLMPAGHRWLNEIVGGDFIDRWGSMAIYGIVLFKLVPGVLILFGALQMMRLRSYAWALAAAILSVVACSLIGLPMGIWALIVLAREDVRETFANAARSGSPRTNPWPWVLGTVLVAGTLILSALAFNFLGETPKAGAQGGNSNASARPQETTTQVLVPPAIPETPSPADAVAATDAAAPGLPPVRIKAGLFKPLTDHDGNSWLPDQGFADGGTAERPNLAIANTEDPELYRTERYGMNSFSYPVPNGKYQVKLHFAETFEDITGPGKRVFTFIVGGHEFKDFDIWAEAGGAQRGLVKTVDVEVTEGRLNIYFIPKQQSPEINGIEILPVSPPAPAVMPLPARTDQTSTASPANPGKIIGELSTTDAFRQDFNKTLPLSARGRVSLDNVNGQIKIAGWDRDEVVIKALKHGKTQESVEAVKINVDSSPDEVVIHTEQPSSTTGFPSSWFGFTDSKRNDASVDYLLQVPQHARLDKIASVNGQIVIDGVPGDTEATTVNGRVEIQGTAGNLKVSTVNGRIEAGLVTLGGNQSVSLDSVNGAIDASLPANANADVSADTLNGGMSSEFPELVVKKQFPVSKHLKGTLGNGSASVKANTVNGSIHFVRGQ